MKNYFTPNAVLLAALISTGAWAAQDVVIAPAPGGGVTINSDATTPAIKVLPGQQVQLPGLVSAATYASPVCHDATGLMGQCDPSAVMGATGPAGPAGTAGSAGPRGQDGAAGSVGPTGPNGTAGPTGATGANGATGATGVTGATGANGAVGAGTIVPFSSNTSIALKTVLGGFQNTRVVVGSSSSFSDIPASPSIEIDATAFAAIPMVIPRAGTIRSISALFSTSTSLSLIGSTVVVQAQLYKSSSTGNVFTPIPGAIVRLPPGLTGIVPVGSVMQSTASDWNFSVVPGDRLMLVFKADVLAGLDTSVTVNGHASASVGID